MKPIIMFRFNTDDQGTQGFLYSPVDDFMCYTMELPWRDNKKMISHIPKGEYECEFYSSKKYREAYIVKNVQSRNYILFHSGNVAGDISKGYLTHSNGCLLLGKDLGTVYNQKAVIQSKVTVNKFLRLMNREPFMLTIQELY